MGRRRKRHGVDSCIFPAQHPRQPLLVGSTDRFPALVPCPRPQSWVPVDPRTLVSGWPCWAFSLFLHLGNWFSV